MRARVLLQPALLLTTLLLATACTAKSPDAASTAAAPAAAATAAASAAAPAVQSAAAPVAAVSAAAATTTTTTTTAKIDPPKGLPPGPAPVEGEDYYVIDTPDQPSGDKVQVVEVFGYGCPHCAHLQPYLAKWEKTLPSDVQVSYLPGPFGGLPDPFQRAFFAAQAMGVQEKSHDAIYKAVHTDKRVTTADDVPKLYADYGIDPKVFASTMQSFAVSAKINQAQDQETRWGITGTPTIVIDGKYRVMQVVGENTEPRLFHAIDWLIAKQRPEHAKH